MGWTPRETVPARARSASTYPKRSNEATPDGIEHPLSVIVDGPTGFVFAWMHETASWKFVGRVGGHPWPGRPIPWQRIQPSFTGELLLMIS